MGQCVNKLKVLTLRGLTPTSLTHIMKTISFIQWCRTTISKSNLRKMHNDGTIIPFYSSQEYCNKK
jgi:hypothetical protein